MARAIVMAPMGNLAAPPLTSTRPKRKKRGNQTLRMVAGLVLIFIGILGVVLPVLPGWILILPGLGMLPFLWARRLRRWIRAKIPGVPKQGPLPMRFWVIMITCAAVGITVSLVWGGRIREAFSSYFG